MRILVALATAAGCAEPQVAMTFRTPTGAEARDTSCVTAVELRVVGANYTHDHGDVQRKCIELVRPAANYAAIHDAIAGQFDVAIPDSGLGGVALLGFSGRDACKPIDPFYLTPDLVFSAQVPYVGQDTIEMEALPNLDCTASTATFRVVDIMALAASGSSTGCANAMALADGSWSGLGTLVPNRFDRGVLFFGNQATGNAANNATQVTGLATALQAAPKSCLAATGVAHGGSGIGCIVGGPSVCAGTGEIEIVSIADNVRDHADAALRGQFPTITFGSVWTSGTPRTPIANATVSIDPKHGRVVYIDPPDADGAFAARRDQSGTGTSGLFVVYADSIADVQVAAVGKTRTVTLGGSDETAGGALIVLP